MNKRAGLAVSLATAALLLSACGGGSTSDPASSPSGAPAASAPAASSAPSSTAASPQPSAGVSVPADAATIGDSIQYDDKVEVTVTQFQNSGDRTTLTVEIDDKAGEDIEGPVDVQVS